MTDNKENSIDFSLEVEKLKARSGNDLSYIECVVELCEKFDVEIEVVKSLLSKPIKDKIKSEAISAKLIKTKHNTLV